MCPRLICRMGIEVIKAFFNGLYKAQSLSNPLFIIIHCTPRNAGTCSLGHSIALQVSELQGSENKLTVSRSSNQYFPKRQPALASKASLGLIKGLFIISVQVCKVLNLMLWMRKDPLKTHEICTHFSVDTTQNNTGNIFIGDCQRNAETRVCSLNAK